MQLELETIPDKGPPLPTNLVQKDAVKPDEEHDCCGNFCCGKLYLEEDVKDVYSLTPFSRSVSVIAILCHAADPVGPAAWRRICSSESGALYDSMPFEP